MSRCKECVCAHPILLQGWGEQGGGQREGVQHGVEVVGSVRRGCSMEPLQGWPRGPRPMGPASLTVAHAAAPPPEHVEGGPEHEVLKHAQVHLRGRELWALLRGRQQWQQAGKRG